MHFTTQKLKKKFLGVAILESFELKHALGNSRTHAVCVVREQYGRT